MSTLASPVAAPSAAGMDLVRALGRARWRLAATRIAGAISFGIAAGAIPALALVALDRLVWIEALVILAAGTEAAERIPPWLLTLLSERGALLIGLATAVAVAALRIRRAWPSLLDAALVADRSLALEERLSTALLVLARADREEGARAVVEDAARAARERDPAGAVRWTVPRAAWVAAGLVLALALVLLVVKPLDITGLREAARARRAEEETVAHELRDLSEDLRAIREDATRAEVPEEIRAALEALEERSRTAASDPGDRAQAMSELSRMADRLADVGRQNSLDELSRILRAARPGDYTRALQEALRAGDIDRALEEIERLRELIANPETPPEVRQALVAELRDLALRLDSFPGLQAALENAAEGLEDGDTGEATEGLGDLAETLRQMGAAQGHLDAIESALRAIQESRENLREGSTPVTRQITNALDEAIDRGDLDAAEQALSDLWESFREGDVTAEEALEYAQRLEEMADQLAPEEEVAENPPAGEERPSEGTPTEGTPGEARPPDATGQPTGHEGEGTPPQGEPATGEGGEQLSPEELERLIEQAAEHPEAAAELAERLAREASDGATPAEIPPDALDRLQEIPEGAEIARRLEEAARPQEGGAPQRLEEFLRTPEGAEVRERARELLEEMARREAEQNAGRPPEGSEGEGPQGQGSQGEEAPQGAEGQGSEGQGSQGEGSPQGAEGQGSEGEGTEGESSQGNGSPGSEGAEGSGGDSPGGSQPGSEPGSSAGGTPGESSGQPGSGGGSPGSGGAQHGAPGSPEAARMARQLRRLAARMREAAGGRPPLFPRTSGGGPAPESSPEGNETFDQSRVRGDPHEGGRIVGQYFTEGTEVRGEARTEFRDVVRSAEAEAAEAVEEETIPQEYRQFIRDYFQSIDPAERR